MLSGLLHSFGITIQKYSQLSSLLALTTCGYSRRRAKSEAKAVKVNTPRPGARFTKYLTIIL